MGEIVSFRPQQGQVRKISAAAERPGAEILFFTGVRYERMAEASPRAGGRFRRSAVWRDWRRARRKAPPARLGPSAARHSFGAIAMARQVLYRRRRDTSPQREAPI